MSNDDELRPDGHHPDRGVPDADGLVRDTAARTGGAQVWYHGRAARDGRTIYFQADKRAGFASESHSIAKRIGVIRASVFSVENVPELLYGGKVDGVPVYFEKPEAPRG